VASNLGIGVKKVDQCVAVTEKLNHLDSMGAVEEAKALRQMLAKSINQAAKKVIVMDLRGKRVIPMEQDDDKFSSIESKADILTRIQENVVEGIAIWPFELLARFEKDLSEFRISWENANLKEAA